MTCKLLRRPLPPLKADLPNDLYLNDPKRKQVPDQYMHTLNLKGDPPSKEQDNKETFLPLPPNSTPIRSRLNTPDNAAGVFINVSKIMFHQNLLKTTKHMNSWSQFPHRPYRKKATQGSLISRLYKEETKLVPPSNSGIHDLITKVSKKAEVSETCAKQIVYSKHTYGKIANLVAERYFQQNSEDKHLNVVDIPTEDLGEVPKRIPQKQLLIELTALIKDHIKETMKIDIQTAIKPLPRFKFGSKRHLETEIILYQETNLQESPTQGMMQRDIDRILQENCLAAGEPKFFQGGKRTKTPFCISDENMATPTEIAILDTIFCGGHILNLKAHFISTIPDISFLKDQLTSLNLSFNNFVTLPDAVLQLQNLETLKVRDNPLCEIPDGIGNLKNMKTLIISFCLLSTFPPKFFELEMLQILDVSYNNLDHIPSQISDLRFLQELSLEGNQLTILPASILSLDLRFLGLRNNFLHHLFWKTTKQFYMEKNSVTCTDELSADAVSNPISPVDDLPEEQVDPFPEEQMDLLGDNLLSRCYNCDAAIKSNSLYDVQIRRNVFGNAALLLLYEVCSLSCFEEFC